MAAVPNPEEGKLIESDLELIDLITGYQPAAAITASLRVGLFDALGEHPRAAGELAGELDADPFTVGALLDTLASLGLAIRTVDGFSTTPFVTSRLTRGNGLTSVVEKEAFFARAWQELEHVVRTGVPVVRPWTDRLQTEPDRARLFLVALDVLANVTGPGVETLSELAPGQSVVDVGGGLGSYAKKLAAAGSEVTLVDLPIVIEWAKSTIGEATSAIHFVSVDLFRHPSVGVDLGSVDAALVSHMLHDFNEVDCMDLLSRVHGALRSGGHIVVNDFAGDLGPGSFGPMFNLMMRVETGGAAHSLGALTTMLEAAGFVGVRRASFDEPLVVLVAQKL
jgi:2-polyprenyl-3-methyl-5-hydroxy-6-metoxy-1,4-benzoquinol methylase